jgi:hypothetical protein
MPRPTPVLIVSEEQQKQIEQWLAALGTPQPVALRSRIVLAVSLVLQFRSSLTYFSASQAAVFWRVDSLARSAARSALVNFHSNGLAVDSQ